MVPGMAETLYGAVAGVNALIALGIAVAIVRYRRDRNAEVLKSRLLAALVAIAWIRFLVALPTVRPVTSIVVGCGLIAMTAYLATPPQVWHLIRRNPSQGDTPDA